MTCFKAVAALSAALLVVDVSAGQASETPPTITSHSFGNHHVTIGWSGPDQYEEFNIRYALGTFENIQVTQSQVGGGTGGRFTMLPTSPGQWVFIVEGCRHGLTQSDCSKWSAQVTQEVPTEASPQTVNYNWGHMAAGDCEMQNANIVFNSYGVGQFTAQVKTNHTHSGDVWHATISGRNAAGQDVVNLGTMDSMRMDDDHGWYNWSQAFQYDNSQFPNIKSANMEHKC